VSGILSWAAALVVLLATSGCAIASKVTSVNPEVPEKLTPVAIDAGLRAFERAETKQRIAQILASPEMKAVEKELVAGMVDSSLAALGEEARAERVGALASRYVAGMVRGLAREGGQELGNAAASAVKSALSEPNKQELARFVSSLVDASVQPIAKRLADADISKATTEQLGPALQLVLERNVGPGLAGAMGDAKIQHALGGAANVMGREMVLGANEALRQMQANSPPESRSLIERLGILANKGANLATWFTWVLAMLVIALAAWSMKLLVATRRYRVELEERSAKARLRGAAAQQEGRAPSDGALRPVRTARGRSRGGRLSRAAGHPKRRRRDA
jgi:hypothetical protein